VSAREHWQNVYETKQPAEVSWYAPHLEESLRLITEVATTDARIIDVGAGASTLVDDLLERGYRRLTALDVSGAALAVTRARLGPRAARVTFVAADVTTAPLGEAAFDVWHDRAVFHFLVDAAARAAYVAQLRRALAPGGHVVMATFAPTGPTRCSGLDVARYDAAGVARELGDGFVVTASLETTHVTPAGKEQRFSYARLRRTR
jgi:SAM-dependent methyltransferase